MKRPTLLILIAAALAALLTIPASATATMDSPANLSEASPATSAAAISTDASAPRPLRVAAFYSSTCNNCHKAKKALAEAQRLYGDRIVVEHHDVADEDQFVLMFDYEDHYDGHEEAPPKVYLGRQCLEGYPEIAEKLAGVIAAELEAGAVTFVPAAFQPEAAESASDADPPAPTASNAAPTTTERLIGRLKTFSAGGVALAGLIDGVNPCAFTTIVFLISMLTHLGKSRRELALVGVGFTLAVFVTYMLLGLGALELLQTIKAFSVTSGLARGIAAAVGLAALGLGAWSLVDYVRLKRSGQAAAMTLGLPHGLRLRINRVIRAGLSVRSLLAGAVVVGILVALLESACTGQIYLPTLVLVLQSDQMRPMALAYLLLYNLMFIAPLAAVLIVAYQGVGSQALARIVQKNLALAKLTLAALFLALGTLVLVTL